jgi:hypothetical protein
VTRPRHPDKDLEEIIREAERHNWRASKGRKYFELLCPSKCGQHYRWVHLTPSDPHYALNLRKWLERQPCWKQKKEEPGP